MTLWIEIPALLREQPDHELERMKAVCQVHRRNFARGPQQERLDAAQMYQMILEEQKKRQYAWAVPPRKQ
jgi:hypothetical protein